MNEKPSLFEHFAVPIPEYSPSFSTDVTETNQDQYDAPSDGAGIANSLTLDVTASTIETRVNGDTYDEDVEALGNSSSLVDMGTALTASNETYDDDQGLASLSFPTSCRDETSLTKTLGDTYDEQSMLSLSFPMS